jgi:hypothetical protein
LTIAEIANVNRDCTSLADYEINVTEQYVTGAKATKLSRYPQWSSSIWDLPIRGIAKPQNGKEQLLVRTLLLSVPIHEGETYNYVLFSEIPEPARGAFRRNCAGSTTPRLDGAYAHDWLDFLSGQR